MPKQMKFPPLPPAPSLLNCSELLWSIGPAAGGRACLGWPSGAGRMEKKRPGSRGLKWRVRVHRGSVSSSLGRLVIRAFIKVHRVSCHHIHSSSILNSSFSLMWVSKEDWVPKKERNQRRPGCRRAEDITDTDFIDGVKQKSHHYTTTFQSFFVGVQLNT